jgi:hypothetical protein
LDRVLEELGIHHEEHKVPPKVLASIEVKSKRVAAKNVTAAAKSKKRKGTGISKAAGKRQKILASGPAASAVASATSSAGASADADEDTAKNTGGGSTLAGVEVEKSIALEYFSGAQTGSMDRPKPSAANPMPSVLGDDSSGSEGTAMRDVEELLHPDAVARNVGCHRPTDGTALEVSDDETGWQSPSVFRVAAFQPRTQRAGGTGDAGAATQELYLGMLVLTPFLFFDACF